MSTFLQFMRERGDLSPVVLVSGKNATLRRLAVEELLSRIEIEPDQTTRIFGDESSTKAVLAAASRNPIFGKPEAVIFEDAHLAPDLLLLLKYLDKPTRNVIVIATAASRKSKTGQRWLPSDERIKYIDCNDMNADQLIAYAKYLKLPEQAAEWLVLACGADGDEVLRNLDILSLFPAPWTMQLVRSVFGRLTTSTIRFPKYVIMDNGDDRSLCSQLRTRVCQLIILTSLTKGGKLRVPHQELTRQTEMERFIIAKVFEYGLVNNTTTDFWLERLHHILIAEESLLQGHRGAREYLAGWL